MLIGGETTSRAHLAVKIATQYKRNGRARLDEARVRVTTSLTQRGGKAEFVRNTLRIPKAVRKSTTCARQQAAFDRVSGARRTPITWRKEEFGGTSGITGVAYRENSLSDLEEFIDWNASPQWGHERGRPSILEEGDRGIQANSYSRKCKVVVR